MKKSLKHLPLNKKREIELIVKYIREEVPTCEMIILYGSYARGDYVDYDQKVEYNVRTFFMSDFDIMVLTRPDKLVTTFTVNRQLDRVERRYSSPEQVGLKSPLSFINETIIFFNKMVSDGRYFYIDIKKEGIMLYDSGNYKLDRIRKLNYSEIHRLATQYYEVKQKKAACFLDDAIHNESLERYAHASFMLHQAVENMLFGIVLVFSLHSPKQHDIFKLLQSVKCYTHEPITAFPQTTSEQKRLLQLLAAAYVQARYNDKFIVTKEDILTLIPQVEELAKIMEKVCTDRLEEYQKKIRSKPEPLYPQ